MKFVKITAVAIAVVLLTPAVAFAAPGTNVSPDGVNPLRKYDLTKERDRQGKDRDYRQRWVEFENDPIKILRERKEKVRSLVEKGKITKERADEINARIDARIKAVDEFNKLPLQQKRGKLIDEFRLKVETGVKEGRLTKEKADALLKEFSDKIAKWDGKGYPRFLLKTWKHKENCGDSGCGTINGSL